MKMGQCFVLSSPTVITSICEYHLSPSVLSNETKCYVMLEIDPGSNPAFGPVHLTDQMFQTCNASEVIVSETLPSFQLENEIVFSFRSICTKIKQTWPEH